MRLHTARPLLACTQQTMQSHILSLQWDKCPAAGLRGHQPRREMRMGSRISAGGRLGSGCRPLTSCQPDMRSNKGAP